MKKLFAHVFAVLALGFAAAAWAGPVNVNQADAATIAQELAGIGQAKAAAIVAYRQEHGPFKKVEDLLKVDGIGEATLEKNRANILLK